MSLKLLTRNDLPEIWQIRHIAMYPDHPLEVVKLAADNESAHFGFTEGDQLVSVITVVNEGDVYQFRKFATLPALQNKGFGSKLLTEVFQWMQHQGATKVWCNARQSAAAYYKKFGMEETEDTYEKYDIRFVKMEKKF